MRNSEIAVGGMVNGFREESRWNHRCPPSYFEYGAPSWRAPTESIRFSEKNHFRVFKASSYSLSANNKNAQTRKAVEHSDIWGKGPKCLAKSSAGSKRYLFDSEMEPPRAAIDTILLSNKVRYLKSSSYILAPCVWQKNCQAKFHIHLNLQKCAIFWMGIELIN